MLRRYVLAVFYFTSLEGTALMEDALLDKYDGSLEDGEKWKFLSEFEHECSWHANTVRAGAAGDDGSVDMIVPVGLVCRHPDTSEIILDDSRTKIGDMALTFNSELASIKLLSSCLYLINPLKSQISLGLVSRVSMHQFQKILPIPYQPS